VVVGGLVGLVVGAVVNDDVVELVCGEV